MRERQRWRPEEDALLRAYVRQYGPREWNLVSQRMNVPLARDAKSCLERWKNYLKPGIKKGSLTEEEQRLVVRLQAKHGNKWKRIAAEVPGRTAKRLGKWWEVFKEKQQRELQDAHKPSVVLTPSEQGKYDIILQSFAEKLVKERRVGPLLMATPVLPPWLSNSGTGTAATGTAAGMHHHPPSPSVTLSLASAAVPVAPPPPPPPPPVVSAMPPMPWLPSERAGGGPEMSYALANARVDSMAVVAELAECCRELEEGHHAWMSHRKEAAWRLKRVELQLESEKACKRREKMEEFEAKMRALREEQSVAMERIEAEYRDQILGLKRDAESKEQKMAEQWAAKHARLARFLEQIAGASAGAGRAAWGPPGSNGDMNSR